MSDSDLIYCFTMINYFCIVFLGVVMCASTIHKDGKVICTELPNEVLEEILGAAFNPRYMSIDQPAPEGKDSGKRMTDRNYDFYVDSDFRQDVEEQPAWRLKNHVASNRETREIRVKRSDYLQEWQCKSKLRWTDLGPDYFPRYQRSVECVSEKCWFNLYKCKPRSFTVKVLRRKRDKCVVAKPGTRVGNLGLPRDLKELWVWEERAVAFCCDCTL